MEVIDHGVRRIRRRGTGRPWEEPLPGSIAVVREGDTRVLQLRGEIDSGVVAAYGDRSPSPAVVDASRVTFLDCRGLGFLVRWAHDARDRGARPVLRRPTRVVRRVIDLAGVEEEFSLAP